MTQSAEESVEQEEGRREIAEAERRVRDARKLAWLNDRLEIVERRRAAKEAKEKADGLIGATQQGRDQTRAHLESHFSMRPPTSAYHRYPMGPPNSGPFIHPASPHMVGNK